MTHRRSHFLRVIDRSHHPVVTESKKHPHLKCPERMPETSGVWVVALHKWLGSVTCSRGQCMTMMTAVSVRSANPHHIIAILAPGSINHWPLPSILTSDFFFHTTYCYLHSSFASQTTSCKHTYTMATHHDLPTRSRTQDTEDAIPGEDTSEVGCLVVPQQYRRPHGVSSNQKLTIRHAGHQAVHRTPVGLEARRWLSGGLRRGDRENAARARQGVREGPEDRVSPSEGGSPFRPEPRRRRRHVRQHPLEHAGMPASDVSGCVPLLTDTPRASPTRTTRPPKPSKAPSSPPSRACTTRSSTRRKS